MACGCHNGTLIAYRQNRHRRPCGGILESPAARRGLYSGAPGNMPSHAPPKDHRISVVNPQVLALPPFYDLPTFDDVASAAHQIAGWPTARRLRPSRSVNARTGANIFLQVRKHARPARSSSEAPTTRCRASRPTNAAAASSPSRPETTPSGPPSPDKSSISPPRDRHATDAPASNSAQRPATVAENRALYDREQEDREAIGARLAEERGLTSSRRTIIHGSWRRRNGGVRALPPSVSSTCSWFRAVLAVCLAAPRSHAAACARSVASSGLNRRGRRCDAVVSVGTIETVSTPVPSPTVRARRSLGMFTFPLIPNTSAIWDGRRRGAAPHDVHLWGV